MKGEITHLRTKRMLEIVLQMAEAQFERNCALHPPRACRVYEGSVYKQGAILTVIIDRCLCSEHATRPAVADTEVWVYDIRELSPRYLGKNTRPELAALLGEPGDIGSVVPEGRVFLKN